MSNHRFGLRVKFSIYGEEFEWDTSMNWVPPDWRDPCNGGIDQRIVEWFAACYAEARRAYDAQAQPIEDSRRWDSELLARLKERYGEDN